MENKIAVITMVKNESDIIESFARHALSYADVLLVVDHNSTDETRKILELLQAEASAEVLHSALRSVQVAELLKLYGIKVKT